MRKLIFILISILVLLSLSACKGTEKIDDKKIEETVKNKLLLAAEDKNIDSECSAEGHIIKIDYEKDKLIEKIEFDSLTGKEIYT